MATCAGPLVSVVIPCFNQGQYLITAIRSVQQQSYNPIETIVVNDGSTDATVVAARQHGVTILSQQNRGVSAARNAGLRAASGDFVIFLDADDELLPDAVQSGVAVLASRPEVSCVLRRCESMDAERRTLPTTHPVIDHADLYRELLLRNFVWTPGAAMFRRHDMEAIGGFGSEVDATGDYGIYLQLARSGRVVFDPRDAVRYRWHNSNMSRDPALMLRSVMAVLRRERPVVPPRYRSAFKTGCRNWQRYYGDQIIERFRREWREGGPTSWQIQACWTLLRHCPGVAVKHLTRKVSRVVRGLPPAEIEPGRFGQI